MYIYIIMYRVQDGSIFQEYRARQIETVVNERRRETTAFVTPSTRSVPGGNLMGEIIDKLGEERKKYAT